MLSDAIRALARTFDEYQHTGLQMAPEAVEAHQMIFAAWALEARNMEERMAGHAAFLPIADASNVVPFRRDQ